MGLSKNTGIKQECHTNNCMSLLIWYWIFFNPFSGIVQDTKIARWDSSPSFSQDMINTLFLKIVDRKSHVRCHGLDILCSPQPLWISAGERYHLINNESRCKRWRGTVPFIRTYSYPECRMGCQWMTRTASPPVPIQYARVFKTFDSLFDTLLDKTVSRRKSCIKWQEKIFSPCPFWKWTQIHLNVPEKWILRDRLTFCVPILSNRIEGYGCVPLRLMVPKSESNFSVSRLSKLQFSHWGKRFQNKSVFLT